MVPYIFLFIVIACWFACFPKIFEKAGVESWKGFVPIYNIVIWLKIMEKPWWWILLLLAPGVNLLMLIIMHVELGKSFNLRSGKDAILAIFVPMYVLPTLAFKEGHKFVGPIKYDDKTNKKSRSKEWGDAIIFAVVAATIIRTFMLEAFTIPTPSMESSMLVGDYLFVSKVSYGPKLPNTPISFPFAHHTLPLTEKTPSYVEWFSMPYLRLPGIGSVERNDVVVFNFPEGDTVVADDQAPSYYALIRDKALDVYRIQKNLQWNQITLAHVADFEKQRDHFESIARDAYHKNKELLVRPVDKRENYIKRCVGIAGDKIEIINREIYINGERTEGPEKMMFGYSGRVSSINPEFLRKQYGIEAHSINQNGQDITLHLTNEQLEKIKAIKEFAHLTPDIDLKAENGNLNPDNVWYRYFPVFPNSPKYQWTKDNFGPLDIPAAGTTVQLNLDNLPIYERIISVYEAHDLEVKGADIFIDGVKADSYTFSMDYYWLRGDNRHNSLDSRFWGFVPEDHVVGKAVFIWFSKDPITGIRWNRLFSLVD